MTEQAPKLFVEVDVADERMASRLRETFLVSVIVHLLVLLTLVTNPAIFEKLFPGATLTNPRPQEVTVLYQPSEAPKPPALPNRPEVPPEVAKEKREPPLTEPVLPRLFARPVVPPPPRPPGLGEKPEAGGGEKDLQARQLPPIGLPEFSEPSKGPPPRQPALEPIKPTPSPSQAQLQLPALLSQGKGTEAILRGLAKERAAGGGQGLAGGYPGPDAGHPNLNIPGPQILSDTMGVDFNPYLLRVYLRVRQNWYAVIPEIARLGRQGKVALEFSIMRDGGVPDLALVAGSGTDSMDTAALSSIRLSVPFPALPAEFPGSFVRLRFIYFYNIPISD